MGDSAIITVKCTFLSVLRVNFQYTVISLSLIYVRFS